MRLEPMADRQVTAPRNGNEARLYDPITQAAFDAAHAIVKRDDLTEEEYARVHGVLGDEQLLEVTVLIGHCSLLSMQLRVFRVTTSDGH